MSSKGLLSLLLDCVALSRVPRGKMKHDKVARAGFACHDAGLSGGQMISVPSFFGIDVEIGRFAIEHIRLFGERDDFGLVLIVVASIDHIGNFLAAGNSQELTRKVAEHKFALHAAVFVKQDRREPEVAWLPRPE